MRVTCLPARRRSRLRLAGTYLPAIAAGGLLALVAGATAQAAAVLHLRCTNPVSGTNWPIAVDLDQKRVDSFAAEISDRSITWHDPGQGYFDLDRATGTLELRNASSTGGYFLHYVCRPE